MKDIVITLCHRWREPCKSPLFAQFLRQAQILILEILNLILWLKYSPYLNLHKNKHFLKVSFLNLLVCISLLFPPAVFTFAPSSITLSWDPSKEGDIAGYGIYLRKEVPGPPYELIDDIYLDELVNRDNPSFTVSEIADEGTYYFAVTAFTNAGVESDFSNALCVQVSGSSAAACSSSGGGAGGCFITSIEY